MTAGDVEAPPVVEEATSAAEVALQAASQKTAAPAVATEEEEFESAEDASEMTALLGKAWRAAAAAMAAHEQGKQQQYSLEGARHHWWKDLDQVCSQGLDIFKGILVVLMTYSHVNLTLLSPVHQYYDVVPHAVGNLASALCFLGFMLAYGFSCDAAYFFEDPLRPRSSRRMERMLRSAFLPVAGAWVTGFGWAFICFKAPMNLSSLLMVLDFRATVGNGPDFLLCFTIGLLTMYPLRHVLNSCLSASARPWRRVSCILAMLLVPLATTQLIISDCTGLRKYFNYFLECTNREPLAPVLPAVPHLLYFNLGVLLSRGVRHVADVARSDVSAEGKHCATFLGRLGVCCVPIFAFLMLLSYPLMSVWHLNYGNLMAPTKWGMVTRGFVNGPSVLWLLGNLYGVAVLLLFSVGLQIGSLPAPAECSDDEGGMFRAFQTLLRPLLGLLKHLGANVLLYLVVGDICLAGLYRGQQNQWPLDTAGGSVGLNGAIATLVLLAVVRFVHYLGASGRSSGGILDTTAAPARK